MKGSEKPEVAIIIPCRNEGIYLKQTLDFILQTEAKFLSNIIVVDDHSIDNCCKFLGRRHCLYENVSLIQTEGIGAAQARNLGAQAAGDVKTLVFCDAHIIVQKNWLNSFLSAFKNKNVSAVCPSIGDFDPKSPAGYGQSWNKEFEVIWLKKPADLEEVPLAPGGCMAVRKEVFDSAGGFDHGFKSWGFEDVEFSLKLWLLGYKIYVHPGVRVGHKFRQVQPYKVDLDEYYYNKLRMAYSHFNIERFNRAASTIKTYPNYDQVLDRLTLSDTSIQRANYFNSRLYDDNWFFNKFNIPF